MRAELGWLAIVSEDREQGRGSSGKVRVRATSFIHHLSTMALDDDGQRPLRLRDDDEDVDGAAPLMSSSSKGGYDGDLGQPRAPTVRASNR